VIHRTPRALIAALIAALAAILLGVTASAANAAAAETRVRASSVAVEVPVGPPEHISAGQRLGNNGQRVVIVVATGVAANTGRKVAIGEDMTNRVEPFARKIGDWR
jgi:hypothetical protein